MKNCLSNISFRDTTDLLVYGHEGWLEFPRTHGHAGKKAEVFLKWGHNMQTDGLCRQEGLKAWVINPAGEKQELGIEDGFPDYYVLSFVPEMEGLYQVVVQLDDFYSIDIEGKFRHGSRREWPGAVESVFYTQVYRTIIPVGHNLTGVINPVGTIMEIGPREWIGWQAGSDLEIEVFLNNQAIAGQEVIIAWNGPDGYRSSVAMTDEKGVTTVNLQEPGQYMFLARTSFPEKVADSHDKRSVTGTVTLLVTGRKPE